MNKVFISYSHTDSSTADEVAQILDGLKIDYFRDVRDIKWGDPIPHSVREGLHSSAAVVVIVSPASLKSHWVPYEIGFATALQKRVLPYLTHPALDLPGYIADLSHATTPEKVQDFFSEPEWRQTSPGYTRDGVPSAERILEIEQLMPDLLAQMKADVCSPTSDLVREFVVLSQKGVSFAHGGTDRFEYYENEHDQLTNKLAILEDYGLIRTLRGERGWKIYRLSDPFVKFLRSGSQTRAHQKTLASTLPDDAIAILTTIEELNDPGVTDDFLAGRLNMKLTKIRHYLNRLEDGDYLYASIVVGEPAVYSLAPKGQAFLVEHDLL